MYLKQKWHTQSMDSPVCGRSRPPASRSDVRPCERTVARVTPGMRVAGAGVSMTSSASASVSGYGEKYLHSATQISMPGSTGDEGAKRGSVPGLDLPRVEHDHVEVALRGELLVVPQVEVLLRHDDLRAAGRRGWHRRRGGSGLRRSLRARPPRAALLRWGWHRRLTDRARRLGDPLIHTLVHVYVVHVHLVQAALQDLDDPCEEIGMMSGAAQLEDARRTFGAIFVDDVDARIGVDGDYVRHRHQMKSFARFRVELRAYSPRQKIS